MTPERPTEEELVSYLLGEAPPERAQALARWSAEFPEQVEPLRQLMQALQVRDEVELVPGIEARLTARQRRRRWTGFFALAAAACALALVVIALPSEEELRTKGATSAANEWAGVELYLSREGEAPVRLKDSLDAGDGLLVAYTNGGGEPFSHLAVFGVASDGRVYWYYPAWLDETEDPMSVPIATTAQPREFPERITHDLPRGRFVVHAVFSRRPLRVSELERLVGEAGDALRPLPLEDTVQRRHVVEVR